MTSFFETLINLLLVAFVLGLNPSEGQATEQSVLIQPFERACATTNVPPKVALAIAKHESGLNPFAVNVAGASYMPSSREEALEIIQQAEAEGRSFDVGLMQINNQWFLKLGVTAESLLDPELNIHMGVKILAGEFQRHGKNWNAVGYYYSPSTSRGLNYSWHIYQLYQGEVARRKALETQQLKQKDIIYAEQQVSDQNLSDRTGIWRNPDSGTQSRVVTFQVRSEGIIRLSGAEPGESAGQTGITED